MEQAADSFGEILKKTAAAVSIALPETCIPDFRTYLEELRRWNRAINLTAIDTQEEIIIKHFIDSMSALKVIEKVVDINILDVGSGAGFPALPLKIVRPEVSISLLEPNEKKSAFLRYLIGSLNLQGARVLTRKLEDYAMQPEVQGIFDYIVVRAYKIDGMGDVLANLLKDVGKLILFRSAKIEREFTLSSLALVNEVEYELPSGYGHRVLSTFSKRIV